MDIFKNYMGQKTYFYHRSLDLRGANLFILVNVEADRALYFLRLKR